MPLSTLSSLAGALILTPVALSQPALAPAASVCSSLWDTLGSTLVKSSGPQYNATAAGTWNLFNSLDHPTCIVYPQTASDVQVAMKSIYEQGARYAVQAGGHSAMIGWNSVTDGILISFENMTRVSYDADTNWISLQPGLRFSDAEIVLEPHGVAIIGGRATDVGVGLLLGGGLNFAAPLYGWSADRIAEMDVVLVGGELITASATNEHSDLFRALKGGANRFGIVTEFRIYAAKTGRKDEKRWYGGSITYPGSANQALLNATVNYINNVVDPNAGAVIALNTFNISASDATILYVFYLGNNLPQHIFGEFLSISSTSQSLSPLSYFDMAFLVPGNARGNGQQFGGSSWLGDQGMFLNGYNRFLDFTAAFAHPHLVASSLIISPILVSQWEASLSGPNAMGNPGVPYASINFDLTYAPGDAFRPEDVDEGFKSMLAETPPSHGLPLFISESNASQDVFETYADLPFLKATYAKYDPTRFNMEHTDGPIGL
ncbi:FAD-binding domain-containing protein [Roridomyces roridus]|uniref:FAD-binding domain-containing protein n=1 Tax=Roridomyces roridus TaxID=1738132 RepID=A0AAD7FDZ6_9AGAR|nr:FAD-binding domain-containing protein [Roridomyces roridus]